MLQTSKQLGNLGWYSLKTGTILDFASLQKNLRDKNIKTMNVKTPSEANLFRKACSSIELEAENGVLKTVKVPDSKVYISRTIILESDRGKKPLGTIRFNKRTNRISLRHSGLIETKYLYRVQDYVDSNKGKIDDSHLRQVIRDFFENKVDGMKLRSGVYFVEKENNAKLIALGEVFKDIDGCNIFTLPIQDSPEQRDMLKVFIEQEYEDKIEEIYSFWADICKKPVNKILVKDVEELKQLVKELETITYKTAMFTDRTLMTQALQDLNEIKLGVHKYEKSLEDI